MTLTRQQLKTKLYQECFNKYKARRGGKNGCKDLLTFLETMLLRYNASIQHLLEEIKRHDFASAFSPKGGGRSWCLKIFKPSQDFLDFQQKYRSKDARSVCLFSIPITTLFAFGINQVLQKSVYKKTIASHVQFTIYSCGTN